MIFREAAQAAFDTTSGVGAALNEVVEGAGEAANSAAAALTDVVVDAGDVANEVASATLEATTAAATNPASASNEILNVLARRFPDPDRAGEIAFKCCVGVSVLACIAIIGRTFKDPETTRYTSTDPDEKKIARQQARGTVASILTALSFGLVNFAIDYHGDVNAATSTALIGMTYGGTVGFLMDNAMGSDAGWKLWSTEGFSAAWRYALGCLYTDRYVRYVITVLFDMFLTLILFKPIYTTTKGLPYFRLGNEAMANGLCSTIIGLITFQAYANVTRFTWAYPATDSQQSSGWIKGGTMQVLVSIAATLFLSSDTKVEGEQPGINDDQVKLPVVLGAMALLWLLSTRGAMQPKLDSAVVPDNVFVVTSDAQHAVGDALVGAGLTDAATGEAVGSDTFRVVRTFPDGKYLVRRSAPRFKYEDTPNPTEEEISADAQKGSLLLLALGLATSYPTIYYTARNEEKKNTLFLSFMAMTAAIAAPGVMA